MGNVIKPIRLTQHLSILLFAAVGASMVVSDFRVARDTLTIQPLSHDIVQASAGLEPIVPIPLEIDLDERKVRLGDKLFHDTRLSRDNTVSCATCHDLKKGGTDQVKYSTGIQHALGNINSPTTFNSGFNFAQFWDGRSDTLAEQVHGPVHNPVEMGTTWEEVVEKLKKDADVLQAFEEIYPDGLNGDNIADAIGVFEMSLITPNCRFDSFLRGDEDAITRGEKDGYRLFKEYGCVSCHQGINIGGNMYQTIGVMADYFVNREIHEIDRGRYNVTKKDWNLYQFKVPGLRNIAVTQPYLHDGSAASLEEVLEVMWNSQLGRSLKPEESELIIQFLNTLTGEYKGERLR